MRHVDYDNSLLSLTASVLAHYGAGAPHPTLPCFDRLLGKDYKNVVVMLFDGMGTAILEKHLPEDAFLRRHLVKTISSVFPPTTTAATVAVESGLSPIEHAWLGWSLYFDEVGANVSIFPNTLSGSDGLPAADYHVALRHLPYADVFEKIRRATGGKVRALRVSPFSDYRSRSAAEICDTVRGLCAEDGHKYIYTYWHQPDYDMHDYGTGHERVAACVAEINALVESLCGGLSDTLVVVTADHGLADVEWRYLTEYPELAACLVRPPSMEARAAAFFVRPGMGERFTAAFQAHFGGDYLLLTREQALEEGWFGPGTPHPRSAGFLGDFIAVATGPVSLAWDRPAQHDEFKAAHAGLTPAEMEVPFIAIEKN